LAQARSAASLIPAALQILGKGCFVIILDIRSKSLPKI
jgi:hypothetical protein